VGEADLAFSSDELRQLRKRLSSVSRTPLQLATATDSDAGGKRSSGPILALDLEDSTATAAAKFILDFDREFRRAVAILDAFEDPSHRRVKADIRPISTTRGGLTIRSAESGSVRLLLEAYGDVQTFLLMGPMQLVITVDWLWSKLTWIPGMRRSRRSTKTALSIVEDLTKKAEVFMRANPNASALIRGHINSQGALEFALELQGTAGRTRTEPAAKRKHATKALAAATLQRVTKVQQATRARPTSKRPPVTKAKSATKAKSPTEARPTSKRQPAIKRGIKDQRKGK
jgi:hypothetical protein